MGKPPQPTASAKPNPKPAAKPADVPVGKIAGEGGTEADLTAGAAALEAAGATQGDPNAPPPPNAQPAAATPVVPNAPVARLSPASAFPDEETKTMISPREFFLLLDDHRRVTFKEGPQEVPTSLQEHKYVLDHGVKMYEPEGTDKKK